MVMKILIRGRIFPKGGGDDAEHPRDITMDTPATRGLLTRAQARAIEAKVNSLLTKPCAYMNETWVLPQGSPLCIIRYTGDAQGEAQDPRQAAREEAAQDEEATAPSFGRPTQFGRPTSKGTKEATKDRSSTSDVGRPTDFGHPKCWTSDRQRTSETLTESWQFQRTSGGLRTSDTPDVRNPTDVRHLLLQLARPLRNPASTTTFGRPNHVRRPTSPTFGRPTSPTFGRPKPACVQRQLGHSPCTPLLPP